MAKRSNRKTSAPAPSGADDLLTTDFVISGWMSAGLRALLIAGATCWVFAPALHGSWIRDDNFYLNSSLLDEPGRLWEVWFQPGSFIEYYPITESVQWLQWRLWHHHAVGYHLTNLVLHFVNALLVWRLLEKFGLRFAWIGGLIFALHPAQVESVAWISELKNTLSLTPFLCAMMAWIGFEERRDMRDYLLALGLFLVAMLCKITMAPFPVVILFYAFWRRGRLDGRDLKACAPFLVISLVLGAIGFLSGLWFAERQVAATPYDESLGILARLALGGSSLIFYFSKFFWPGRVLPMYPQWPIDPSPLAFVPWLLIFAGCYVVWVKRRTRGRHALLGLGFFTMFLAPFLGFLTVSYMRFTWVMDHFLYLPMIGLIGLVVAVIGDIEARLSLTIRPIMTGLLTLALALMAFEAHAYSGAFINEVTLWDYTIEYNPWSWGARYGLGDALMAVRKFPDAIEQYQVVEALRPFDHEIHNDLALALSRAGRMPEAMDEFKLALQVTPNSAHVHNNMGLVLAQVGRYPEAIAQYQLALALRPNDADVHANLAHALTRAGRMPEAVQEFQQAVKLKPDDGNARNNLGFLFGQMGRIPEAIEQLKMAQQLDPQNLKIRDNLDRLEAQQKAAPGGH